MVETDAENFQLVMHNLSLFVDKVHNGAYDLGLVCRKSLRRYSTVSLMPRKM